MANHLLTLPVLALAFSLAIDAMIAAAVLGIEPANRKAWRMLLVAMTFGTFQAGMPYIGYALGAQGSPWLGAYLNGISALLLAAIGAKMCREGLAKRVEREPAPTAFDARILLSLGLATSLDALVAGVTLPTFEVPIPNVLAAIGIVTSLLSLCGMGLGRTLASKHSSGLTLLGGATLIALGLKSVLSNF